MAPHPAFPGATAVSTLRSDSTGGGMHDCPHVHLACTEAYVVVRGEGELHTLTIAGLERRPLRPGIVVWFAPGTVHRAIDLDGALEVVVVTQNSGMVEAGDVVPTFPPEHLESPEAYRLATRAEDEPGARQRRDLAIEGFEALADAVNAGEPAALAGFYRQAVQLRSELYGGWDKVLRSGALAAAERTAGDLWALRQGRIDHLLEAAVRVG